MFEDEDYDDLRDRFMGGGCHALALAVSERTGWPMAALWLAKGRREEIVHVAVLVPGDGDPAMREYLDIGGVRGLPEILDDLEADDEGLRIEEVDADALRRMTARSRPSHRKLPDLTEALVAEASDAAERLLDAVLAQDVPSP